jgi:hypothetical protein
LSWNIRRKYMYISYHYKVVVLSDQVE